MSETSTAPTSTLGIVGAVVLALAGLVAGWIKYRSAGKSELKSRIEEAEEALRAALDGGRVADAAALSRRLDRLYRLYRRDGAGTAAGECEVESRGAVTPSLMAKVSAVALVVAAAACMAAMAAGCAGEAGI